MIRDPDPSDPLPESLRESERAETDGFLSLQHSFGRLELLASRADQLDVTDGSVLAGDRDATLYNSIPDLVYNLLGVAVDHLQGVQLGVEGSNAALLAMSPFTLIRSTLEASATGLWVLQPNTRDERVLKSRRLVFDNRRQQNVLRTEIGATDTGFTGAVARLQDQIDRRPGIAGQQINKYESVTTRLQAIAARVPHVSPPPLALWRMASGIAHGNTHIGLIALHRETLGTHTESGSGEYMVRASFHTVAVLYEAALDLIEALIDLYDELNSVRGE